MSYNRSRSDRSETQYRKTGRSVSFNFQRSSSGSYSKGAGAGPAPSSAVTTGSHSVSSNRSFKKSDNAQHGQARLNTPAASSSQSSSGSTPCNLQNDAHVQPQSHRVFDTPKTTEPQSPQGSTREAAKAPTPQSATLNTEGSKEATPETALGDSNEAFAIKFGSLSPGVVNGMQVPPRTTSAPPSLDEQKRAQARYGTSVPVPNLPNPVPKQQLNNKNVVASNTGEAYAAPKEKRVLHVSSASPPSSMQKAPAPSAPNSSRQMPPHPPQVPLQFGGSNSQIQPPNVTAASLQMPMPMPMPLPMGSAPHIQQAVLVQGLQSHPISHQSMMHQGHGLRFTSSMNPQLPPQLSHMGMGMMRQYAQQQGGMFGGQRKTSVKITHPDTREELKLDRRSDVNLDGGSSGARPYPNISTQSHPVSTFSPSQHMNYFPNSYSTGSVFFPPNSLPLTIGKMITNPQAPRYTYPVAQGSHADSSAHKSISVSKPWASSHVALHSSLENARDTKNTVSSASSGAAVVNINPVPVSAAGKGQDSFLCDPSATENVRSPKPSRLSGEVIGSAPQRDIQVRPGAGPQSADEVSSGFETLKAMGDKVPISDVTEPKPEGASDGSTDFMPEVSSCVPSINAAEDGKPDLSTKQDGLKPETQIITADRRLHEKSLEHSKLSGEPVASGFSTRINQIKEEFNITGTLINPNLNNEIIQKELNGPEPKLQGAPASHDSSDVSLVTEDAGSCPNENGVLGASLTGMQNMQSLSNSMDKEGTSKLENDCPKTSRTGSTSIAVTVPQDKSSTEATRGKNMTSRGKKKRKEILQKADAAGATFDLYMAYKGTEEEKEVVVPVENNDSDSGNGEQMTTQKAVVSEDFEQKTEPDDWEDAADLSSSRLNGPDDVQVKNGGILRNGEAVNGSIVKKYSRDFLLKFASQFTGLPHGFVILPEIADTLMSYSSNASRHGGHSGRDSHANPGRAMDRQGNGSRLDRRASSIVDDERWNKFPGPFASGRDPRTDMSYVVNIGSRPSQGGNFGVLRNPRAHAPVHYASGILSGQMQSAGPYGGTIRNNPDADRWLRGANFQQKGLIPSPHTPLQMMHKAEKKYEVGKVSDEEEAKQRKLKGILNKLTPQNFDKLFEQVKEVNIDSAVTLTGVISQIFDKALMEPTFCEMYARFCYFLARDLPDFVENGEKITFKRLLLNKCQEEFERGEREEEEARKIGEGEANKSEEEREMKRVKARRRMLGNIRLIGELYKKKMLTERIMHSCIQQLLRQYPDPDEEDIEALCKLLSTIGEMIDYPKAKEHIDAYFQSLIVLSDNKKLSSRVRFMLKDVIDLRKNNWQQRRKIEGPKKIEEVHRDAAQERQTQGSRLSRGPSVNARRGPSDFGPRGSNMMPFPTSQMGSLRGSSSHARGCSPQDARFSGQSYEPRALSVSLPQRPVGDESLITLGPQGGLGKGMSVRGSAPMPSVSVTEVSAAGDSRRMRASFGGASPITREDASQRSGVDRPPAHSGRESLSAQESGMEYCNRDLRSAEHAFDRPVGPSVQAQGPPSYSQNVYSERVAPEERLHQLSMAAIKEFYSARDEKEVALCITDLNSPSFHPKLISLWVTDSFERKDVERDLLAKLLINLVKPTDGPLSQGQLVKGFDSVLTGLEDAVHDAPKAAEFLGRMFATAIAEKVITLREVGQLVYEGGEEPGRLLEIGLAGDVLRSTLELIKSEKGEAVMNDLLAGSDIRLEDF